MINLDHCFRVYLNFNPISVTQRLAFGGSILTEARDFLGGLMSWGAGEELAISRNFA